jgi:DNA-binding transcriptional MocR family regulator
MDIDDRYQQYLTAGLKLDLTRGKPCPEQLTLSEGLDATIAGDYFAEDGTDTRNYGGILGIPEARRLGGLLMSLDPSSVMAGGNSSLTLMHQFLAWRSQLWRDQTPGATPKFLCVVPGYDRHFTICEQLGIEMLNVGFDDRGPDMQTIEALVEANDDIRGIWCVPKHSNPTGHCYHPETVARLAELPKRSAGDFIVMWDNAYAVHDLVTNAPPLANVLALATEAGTQDQIAHFASTSKITFAGAGLAFCGLSPRSLKAFETFLVPQMIGFDKVNQLRHGRFFKDATFLKSHMEAHQKILLPKFELVQTKLSDLTQAGLVTRSQPEGGYFVSLDLTRASAKQVIELAKAAGVTLTPAGATFPYGLDPQDKNIRIAPSFPDMMALDQALDVLTCCIVKASTSTGLP